MSQKRQRTPLPTSKPPRPGQLENLATPSPTPQPSNPIMATRSRRRQPQGPKERWSEADIDRLLFLRRQGTSWDDLQIQFPNRTIDALQQKIWKHPSRLYMDAKAKNPEKKPEMAEEDNANEAPEQDAAKPVEPRPVSPCAVDSKENLEEQHAEEDDSETESNVCMGSQPMCLLSDDANSACVDGTDIRSQLLETASNVSQGSEPMDLSE